MNRHVLALLASALISLLSTYSLISWYQDFSETHWIIIGFTFLFFWTIFFFMYRTMKNNPGRFLQYLKKVLLVAFWFLFSFVLLWSLKSSTDSLRQETLILDLFVLVWSYLTILVSVSWFTILLLMVNIKGTSTKVPKRRIIFYALIPIVCWSFYLVAYFPGTMTPDSLSHWEQIHTLDFSNWHPVVYTWYIMLLTTIWKSPAIIAFSQIVLLALFGGYAAYSIEKNGVSQRWIWVGIILFALYPLNGIFPIAIWKDILYSGLLFLFTVLIFNIVASKGQWLKSYSHLVIFGLVALATSLMRTNGLPITVVMGILLLITFRQYFLRIVITTGAVLVMYFAITGPFFDYMDVRATSPNEALSIPTQQFAHIIKEDGDLSEKERQYLGNILPYDKWAENYNPYLTDPIKFDGEYNQDVIFDDFGFYLNTWASVVSKNFGLAVESYLNQTSILWQINQPEDGYTSTYARNVYLYNDYDLKTDPLSSTAYRVGNKVLVSIERYLLEPLLRPAFYTAIILLSGVVLALRNNGKALLIIAPVLLNTGVMLLATPAQDFRYQFANVLITFFAIGILFIRYESKEKKVQHE
ncbi:DUF6020 family protein [Halobacillus trueperi]|uniref:DUF6020 family protein n=1 Tax=Halobacillus trueperi TaxID=156205 RepID=UPI00373536D9